MATFISHSPAETESLGEEWGRAAQSGWVIGLSGDLGAGKTTLIKMIGEQLGVDGIMSSPSFAIVNEYDARDGKVFHFDFYRIKNEIEAANIGVEDYFYSCIIQFYFKQWAGYLGT